MFSSVTCGSFQVRLVLGKDYPQGPPKGSFLTKIFHPNVSNAGEICVNTLKKDWKSNMGIKHILLVIKCLLIVPNAESALNEEAGMLLLERYETYCERAKLMTEIHARRAKPRAPAGGPSTSKDQENTGEPSAKKQAVEDKAAQEKRKILKEKKRNLKRL
jgi:ubiquitin-conjugating enzyme E2 S